MVDLLQYNLFFLAFGEVGIAAFSFAMPIVKILANPSGFAVVLPRSDKNLLRQNSEGLKTSRISSKFRCRKCRQAGACQD